jgi:hypothetical protein
MRIPTEPTDQFTRGHLAYSVFFEHVGGVTLNGNSMPDWDNLPDKFRAAWEAVAETFINKPRKPKTDLDNAQAMS